ncbi:MAG TPA: glycosyltransferase family 2 protein [Candidatus Paceibacterota bacterium]|nr:glycosyltransferase family 2 protein [Candidatus Paceibacterota bacterium]
MRAIESGISVVIPVYNSEQCLETLCIRLQRVLHSLTRNSEIILVNDASRDGSWLKICALARSHSDILGLDLRKNFGQDSAIMAGLRYARGRFIIIMDDDLQHDPEDIPKLVARLENGADVCYGRFARKRQTWFKNAGSWFNDKVANVILKKPKGIYLSPFKGMHREIAREISRYTGPYPYIDGLLFRVTSRIDQVDVAHHARYAGKGNFTLRKSIRVWTRLATNFSITPLRIATVLGFLTSLCGFTLAVVYIVRYIIGMKGPEGWASLMVVVLCIGGVQMVSLGIVGEYVGRLFLHNSKHPQFAVRQIVGKAPSRKSMDDEG